MSEVIVIELANYKEEWPLILMLIFCQAIVVNFNSIKRDTLIYV